MPTTKRPKGGSTRRTVRAARTPGMRAVPDVKALAPATTVSPQMGVFDSSDGKPNLVWSRHRGASPYTAGYIGSWPMYAGNPGAEIAREHAVVSSVARDFLHSNPTIATIVGSLVALAVGTGLTLSAKPDATALGISEDEARKLAHAIEQAWASWAGSTACDASGRDNLHKLAAAAFRSWLLTGESLFLIEGAARRGAMNTCVRLLDSRQLDQSINRLADGGRSGNVVQGVEFDDRGELRGYWIRNFTLGSATSAPMAQFVAAKTSWGRTCVGHVFDLLVPGQIRGISPLAAALTPAQTRNTLREFTTTANLIQTMFAATIESDNGRNTLKEINGDGLFPNQAPPGFDPRSWVDVTATFYEGNPLRLEPGAVNHLMPNEKLVLHRSQHPNNGYADFDKSLTRDAARASGLSFEQVSGNFADTNFSAARLALDLPWRELLRHRSNIVETFYGLVHRAFLEEAIETQRIEIPKNAPQFWENPTAYTRCAWRGSGRPIADMYKQNQADALALASGFATLEQILGERGMDLEETLSQRAAEKALCEAAGLPYGDQAHAAVKPDETTKEDTHE